VGTDWQFVGLGRFFGSDTTDMLLRSASTGGFEVYDISNNNITNAAALGTVGLEHAHAHRPADAQWSAANEARSLRQMFRRFFDGVATRMAGFPILELRQLCVDVSSAAAIGVGVGLPQGVVRQTSLRKGATAVLRVGGVDRK
jgi:hypothetical protein